VIDDLRMIETCFHRRFIHDFDGGATVSTARVRSRSAPPEANAAISAIHHLNFDRAWVSNSFSIS
jgi:hypothetical protein